MNPLPLSRIGTALVITLLIVSPVLACPFDSHPQNYVKIHFLDITNSYGDFVPPVRNTTITITPVQTTYNDWLFEMFGISKGDQETDYTNTTVVTTDEKGDVVLSLRNTMEYNITVRNNSYYLYPFENEYYLFVR